MGYTVVSVVSSRFDVVTMDLNLCRVGSARAAAGSEVDPKGGRETLGRAGVDR
jgi:hypothetical protein